MVNDPLDPQAALLKKLQSPALPGGNIGAQGQPLPPGQLTAQSVYDTSNQTPDQAAAMASATAGNRAKDQAGAQADQDYLSANGGNWGTRQQYRPTADPSAADFGGKLVGGLDFLNQQAGNAGMAPGEGMPNAGPAPTLDQPIGAAPKITLGPNGYSNTTPGRPFLLGFDTGKLTDPASGSADGSKYTPAAKAFGQAYLGGADIGRGNLGPMVNAIKQQFPNAKAVGEDKIDFGDGAGPIDVIGSDGSVRFQNTTDNAQWEGAHGGGGGAAGGGGGAAPAAGPMGGGGGGLPGGNIDSLLSGDPMAQIQAALAQYAGQPRSNAQALLQKLAG